MPRPRLVRNARCPMSSLAHPRHRFPSVPTGIGKTGTAAPLVESSATNVRLPPTASSARMDTARRSVQVPTVSHAQVGAKLA